MHYFLVVTILNFLFQIIFYIFAVIGIEVFQGKIKSHAENETNVTTDEIYCGAEVLKGSGFYDARYCSLNFNDFISSILVLSTILFENNWHSILYKFISHVTG